MKTPELPEGYRFQVIQGLFYARPGQVDVLLEHLEDVPEYENVKKRTWYGRTYYETGEPTYVKKWRQYGYKMVKATSQDVQDAMFNLWESHQKRARYLEEQRTLVAAAKELVGTYPPKELP